MISLLNICEKLNELLNTNKTKYTYKIYSESEFYRTPKRVGNKVEQVLEGIATIISSSIVPVQGLKFGTQTIAVEIAVPIDTREMEDISIGIENIVERYKQDINALVSEPISYTIDNYVVTMTGTLAEVGEQEQQSSIGLMIPISFTITLNYFLNGLNSLYQKLYFNNEEIKFTGMSLARNVIQDGGVFSDSSGVTKNYVQATGLAIELTLPATSDSTFCSRFREFLRDGNNNPFSIKYIDNALEKTYKMIFLTSNLRAQGVDNVGYTITLAEAL